MRAAAAAAAEAEEHDGRFEVWPENMPAADLFWRLQTQWEQGYVGIKYESVQVVMALMKFDDPLDVFNRFQVMEVAASHTMNEGRHHGR